MSVSNNFFESKIITSFRFGANFFELVGPNKTIMGILAKAIICIIPLSIETAVFNLEARAVTKAGQANLELNSGKISKNIKVSKKIISEPYIFNNNLFVIKNGSINQYD